jgi:hypothetical protein
MEILVFGLEEENRILARLRKRFPSVGFKKYDISEELENENRRPLAIDTVKGISRVTLIEDIASFSPGRALEGSGALMTLRILISIGSLDSARVIGVPAGYPAEKAFEEISAIIETLGP